MKIRICHLSEGVAGHDGQVFGVIKTLRDAGYDVSTKTVSVRWKIHFLRSLLRLLSRKLSKYPNFIARKLILFCYKFALVNEVDVIISGGANLAPLNLAISKTLKVKNIHLSTPRDWKISDFSAYITSSKVSTSPSLLFILIVDNLFVSNIVKVLGIKFICVIGIV